ncbi:MAG: homocysteine S-methyltransferase family protein [Desulfobacteraceae bacterium]
MEFSTALRTSGFLLMEAAIIETLVSEGKIELHPRLLNALLIYDRAGKRELLSFFDGYVSVADRAGAPMLICTSTWRANRERVTESGIKTDVNADSVRFLQNARTRWDSVRVPVYIGGLMGCRNDAYKPGEALSAEAARTFHVWQAEKLAAAGPDYLMAATMPAVSEAAGMAEAMSETGIPYIISFVIGREGFILDGTPLEKAFSLIDETVSPRPAGYMVNCAYPSFLCPESRNASVYSRLIGYQANASSMDHSELDLSDALHADDVQDWGRRMVELNRRFGVKILGGCCGTGKAHLDYLADHL